MGTEIKKEKQTCSVCINASTVTVNIDECTPLIGRSSGGSSGGRITNSALYVHHRHEHGLFSWLLVTALFLFFFTGIGIATYLLFNEGVDFMPEIYKFVPRNEWNAAMSNGTLFTISIPSDNVIITDTQTQTCDRRQDCDQLMRRIQRQAQHPSNPADSPLPDLRYNFLIDETGTIYEGLGWYQTLQVNERSRLLVALIGNYLNPSLTPTSDQLIGLKILLKFAVDKSVLTPCYNIMVNAEDAEKVSLVGMAAMLQVDAYRECLM